MATQDSKAAKIDLQGIVDELWATHCRYVYCREALGPANSPEITPAVGNVVHEVLCAQNDRLEDLISRVSSLGEGAAPSAAKPAKDAKQAPENDAEESLFNIVSSLNRCIEALRCIDEDGSNPVAMAAVGLLVGESITTQVEALEHVLQQLESARAEVQS